MCLPRNLTVSRRKDRGSSVSTVCALRPVRSGVRIPLEERTFLLPNYQTGHVAHPAFYSMGTAVCSRGRVTGAWRLSLIIYLLSTLRMGGYISPRPYLLSWRGQGNLYLYLLDSLENLWFEYCDRYTEYVGVGKERLWRCLKCYPRLEITRKTWNRIAGLWLRFQQGTSRMRHLIG
jgi:hypothetical protein